MLALLRVAPGDLRERLTLAAGSLGASRSAGMTFQAIPAERRTLAPPRGAGFSGTTERRAENRPRPYFF